MTARPLAGVHHPYAMLANPLAALNLGADPLRIAIAVGLVSWAAILALAFLRRLAPDAGRAALGRLAGVGAVLGTGIWSAQAVLWPGAGLAASAGGLHALGLVAAWMLGAGAAMVAATMITLGGPSFGRRAIGVAALILALLGPQQVALNSLVAAVPRQSSALGPLLALAIAAVGAVAAVMLAMRAARAGASARGLRLAAAGVTGVSCAAAQVLALAGVSLPSSATSAGGVLPAALFLLATVGTISVFGVLQLAVVLDRRSGVLRRMAEAERQRLASTDPLTALDNRAQLEERLHAAAAAADSRLHGRIGLALVDLDGFRPINESLGHANGDRLLQELARRLRDSVAPRHAVARLNGDKFVLLLDDDPTADSLAQLAGDLLPRLQAPVALEGREVSVSCSIGLVLYPQHGAASTLIAHAEAAMASAKRSGGASYCFFEPHMSAGSRDQIELLRDLRVAIERGQLELYFQPKVHAPTGEITGAEALVRWNHPRRGLVSPALFIPVAERFGLIRALGDWVIDAACRQARAWRDNGLRMRVAINLSMHQLRQDDLVDRIAAALARHKVNPRLLTCEITETAAMDDTEATRVMFERLARLGVHISIDDFGTGYSSLASLRKLPAEELKIDQGFVQDLESSDDARAIVDAVVKLAHALGLKVVAEGVETEAQHRILRALGCHELQGFVFAKPMSAQALALWAMDDVGPRPMAFRSSLFADTDFAAVEDPGPRTRPLTH